MNTNIINKQRRAAVDAGGERGAQSLIFSLLVLAVTPKHLTGMTRLTVQSLNTQ